jgi:hypothetical protein
VNVTLPNSRQLSLKFQTSYSTYYLPFIEVQSLFVKPLVVLRMNSSSASPGEDTGDGLPTDYNKCVEEIRDDEYPMLKG